MKKNIYNIKNNSNEELKPFDIQTTLSMVKKKLKSKTTSENRDEDGNEQKHNDVYEGLCAYVDLNQVSQHTEERKKVCQKCVTESTSTVEGAIYNCEYPKDESSGLTLEASMKTSFDVVAYCDNCESRQQCIHEKYIPASKKPIFFIRKTFNHVYF